jgi:putative peptide zinc metalloprotease protein
MNVTSQIDWLSGFRPSQLAGVEAHHREERGRRITILKRRNPYTYYQLSDLGSVVWSQLDGRKTIMDLLHQVVLAGTPASLKAVSEIVRGLLKAGFVQADPRFTPAIQPVNSLWNRAALTCQRVLTRRFAVRDVDKFFTRLYQGGGFLLFCPAVAVLLTLLGGWGLISFFASAPRELMSSSNWQAIGGFTAVALALWLKSIPHELAHGLTVKHFGREVPEVGFGWYWFNFIFFVNTSDMWLAGRWPRIAVSLAGPYSDFLLAGVAALLASHATPDMAPYMWLFSAGLYLSALFNLCPLLEYDGYYVLMDLLDRPNLRGRAIVWLLRDLRRDIGAKGLLRQHLVDLLYGIGSLLYLILMAIVTLWLWHTYCEGWLTTYVSAGLVTLLGWGVILMLSVPMVLGIAGEVRQHSTQ